MKFNLILCSLFLLCLSCSKSTTEVATAELPATIGVSFIESPAQDLVTLESTGFGNSVDKAETDAVEQAFKHILFQGLPSFTALRLPMVADKAKVEQKKPKLFDKFFSSRAYLDFIKTEEAPSSGASIRGSKKYQVSKVLTINYRALRKHMEKIGGVRKFGL